MKHFKEKLSLWLVGWKLIATVVTVLFSLSGILVWASGWVGLPSRVFKLEDKAVGYDLIIAENKEWKRGVDEKLDDIKTLIMDGRRRPYATHP